MFFNISIDGSKLPDKVISLTYDDGPGPNTLALGQYLFDLGIPAAFFVIGERAKSSPDILVQLQNFGHLVANHTWDHPNMYTLAVSGSGCVKQVLETDALLKSIVGEQVTLFRPPYGAWREDGEWRSPAAEALNHEAALLKCIGPIMWDLDGSDWAYWRNHRSPEECAQAYLDLIGQFRRGIVLMHDYSWETHFQNQSLAMAQKLIPELLAQGYRFIRLDAVPQVASAMQVTRRVALKTADGRYFLSVKNAEEVCILELNIGDGEEFGMVELGDNRVALRAPNGYFLSVPFSENAKVVANADRIGVEEIFKLHILGNKQVALETHRAHYFLSLQTVDGREILTTKFQTDAWETFSLIGL